MGELHHALANRVVTLHTKIKGRFRTVDAKGNVVSESALPDFVQTGMKDAKARMFERRYNLGEAVFHTATGERGTLPRAAWCRT